MTELATQLVRLSKCPGSARTNGENVQSLYQMANLWTSGSSDSNAITELKSAVHDASEGRNGIDALLWFTGAMSSVKSLQYATEDIYTENTQAGDHCESCPSKSICRTRLDASFSPESPP